MVGGEGMSFRGFFIIFVNLVILLAVGMTVQRVYLENKLAVGNNIAFSPPECTELSSDCYSVFNLTTCGKINESGIYNLQKDLSVNGSCFFIDADYVMIDGQGHSIIGDGPFKRSTGTFYADSGVIIANHSNVAVSNISFFSFKKGLSLSDVKSSSFSEISVTSDISDGTGVRVSESSSNTFMDISVTNARRGFYLDNSSSNNLITQLNANKGVYGLYIEGSDNEFKDINSGDNAGEGVYIDFGNDNRITSVTSVNNHCGILINGGFGNKITSSSLQDNTYCGIGIGLYSYSPIALNNVIKGFSIKTTGGFFAMGGYGIYLKNSKDNEFIDGKISGSEENNLYKENSVNDSFENVFYSYKPSIAA